MSRPSERGANAVSGVVRALFARIDAWSIRHPLAAIGIAATGAVLIAVVAIAAGQLASR